VSIILLILMFGAILVIFLLAWRWKWPAWSATWYPFFVATPLMLASYLIASQYKGHLDSVIDGNMVMFVVIPLILAVVLYTVTRRDPLRGLLATLLVLYILWMIQNMDFLPFRIEVAIKILSTALICLVIAYLLGWRNWRTGLYAVLAMNLVVGFLFSYAGIYHGGMLPSSASGPSLAVVVRSLLPQYLVMGAILVGPLFAWKIRQAGRSAGRAGRIGYHLALAGLLLIILANLAGLRLGQDAYYGRIDASTHSTLVTAIVLGLGVYLLSLFISLFFLFRDTPHSRTVPGWSSPGWTPTAWAQRILLVLLPLAIPLIFMLPFDT
jgi:hypothetical protein